ncbi:daunorubicin resistance protein DrrA family ABC transporter ATP-binding protein [Thermorudis peleae]|uniref:daunorubicin resistance protein DrrA family ABC transporter ATP-binding protein n=1 Tax=Thermorudis peleae TaxID=1382356 RepID=UPI00056F71F0|nr:daunorubicin resistance protein DrrA family ABC transporter ATP-binding protein [Thermorudis peleae]
MDEVIVVEGLRKRYANGVQALDGLSFRVKRGEIFGLLGPNGAGKSTTVRILATLTLPDSGTARIAGFDVVRQPQQVRRQIGYVAQASGVDRWLTGRENLLLQARLERLPAREARQRADELLTWLGLADAADRIVNTYSGGMRRRLDIAIGLIHRPAVVFLDEPTTGLDPEARAALWQILLQLRAAQSISILLTTHYLDEADRLCDRLAIVDHGRVVAEGTPEELKAELQGDRVTLEVGREQTAMARSVLTGLPEVLTVIVDGPAVIARVPHGASALPVLVTTLERAGITVQTAAVHRPSLDDVYLHHTGRRFEDEREASEMLAGAGTKGW